jgi:hypothetical protein
MITIKRIKAGNYVAGQFNILRINELWLVWNNETQTRTARNCPNSKWFPNLAAAKTYVLEQTNKAGI